MAGSPRELIEEGRLSVVRPAPTCDETVERRDGWPAEDEFYKLEATVSEATLSMPCVAICMFDVREHPGRTILKAAFEGHPITLHRNCIRENPYYVPRSEATHT